MKTSRRLPENEKPAETPGWLVNFMMRSRRGKIRKLLDGGETNGQAGFLPIDRGFVDHPCLGGLVEGRTHVTKRLGGVIFFPGGEQPEIILFQCLQPRLHAAVPDMFASAVSCAAFR